MRRRAATGLYLGDCFSREGLYNDGHKIIRDAVWGPKKEDDCFQGDDA